MSDVSTLVIHPAEGQPAFRGGAHDSLQYHFFSGEHFFAARLFLTRSLEHTSVWMYDGGVTELFSSGDRIEQSPSAFPDVQVGGFRLCAEEPRGHLSLETAATPLRIDFEVRQAYAWREPRGTVVHQPDLLAEIRIADQVLEAVGYCKRYCWDAPPGHWGYRFIHGAGDEGSDFVWTADATFGLSKYAYFNLLTRGGLLRCAAPAGSCHVDDGACAEIEGERYRVTLDELGCWQSCLQSPLMDSLMTQRYCRMTLSDGTESITGPAVNELCFGTLG